GSAGSVGKLEKGIDRDWKISLDGGVSCGDRFVDLGPGQVDGLCYFLWFIAGAKEFENGPAIGAEGRVQLALSNDPQFVGRKPWLRSTPYHRVPGGAFPIGYEHAIEGANFLSTVGGAHPSNLIFLRLAQRKPVA